MARRTVCAASGGGQCGRERRVSGDPFRGWRGGAEVRASVDELRAALQGPPEGLEVYVSRFREALRENESVWEATKAAWKVRALFVPALVYDIGDRVWWPSRLSRSSR